MNTPLIQVTNNEQMVQALEEVANFKSVDAFVESYVRDDNKRVRMLEGMGIALANWTKWDSLDILKILAAALEDANFHEEVQTMIERIEGM